MSDKKKKIIPVKQKIVPLKKKEEVNEPSHPKQLVESYEVVSNNVVSKVNIIKKKNELSLIYELINPEINEATSAILEEVRNDLVREITLTTTEILDIRNAIELKKKFESKITDILKKKMPNEPENNIKTMTGHLLNKSFGLGDIEVLINDPHLEEIVVNGGGKNLWVYHKTHGWLKTNIIIQTESQVYNYSSSIARKVGRQISVLDPLLDAHLVTGDRVNSTLFPISTTGNTITIRKFRRKPWSVPELIANKTMSDEMMSFLWLCIESEISVIFSGGTGSGKTTVMNAVLALLPGNRRIISIEDTREIKMPDFLHWVPLTTREANPEGKGQITMLELLINSLRMRPDCIIVGEIRRREEAEVLFEAIHTGHSVYSTLHADTAVQTIKRLTNDPLSISPTMVESLPLIVVMYRQRRMGIRRVLEISEVYGADIGGREETININDLWRWMARDDNMEKVSESLRIFNELKMRTGMSEDEIGKDLSEKKFVLNYMVKNKIFDINETGKIINDYYIDRKALLNRLREKK
ncbi:MAG: type II/IV secretion system ATPase subunit [Nanoarchaeota archaeon]|nr:type II/IV secretion system ATPase subunit [Nanoarchaeota archaeon]